MSARVFNLRQIFHSVRLDARSASRAFPLVQLFDPGQSAPEWIRFVRSHSRSPRSGVNAIADQRGYLHAVFVWRVELGLTWGRILRVSCVVVGGLPGRALQDAVIRAVSDLAEVHECNAILVEAGEERCGLAREILHATGYVELSGWSFVHRLPHN